MFGGYEAVHEATRSHLNDDDEMFGVFQITGSVFCVRAFYLFFEFLRSMLSASHHSMDCADLVSAKLLVTTIAGT